MRHGKALGSRDLMLNMSRMTFTQSPWREVLDWMSLGGDRSAGGKAPCRLSGLSSLPCYFSSDVFDRVSREVRKSS